MDWEEEEDGTTKSCTSVRLHSKYLGGSQRVCPHAERKDAGEDRGDRGSAPAAARRKRD
jgi:hypothetical protein